RDGEAWLVYREVVIQQQVEVDRARPPPLAASIAAELPLDAEEDVEQRAGRQVGLQLDRPVQIGRLLDGPPRLCLAQARDRHDPQAVRLGEELDRPLDRCLPITEFRA